MPEDDNEEEEGLLTRVKELVARYSPVEPARITPESRLWVVVNLPFHLIGFATGSEAPWLRSHLIPITVADLVEAARAGRWVMEYPAK